jgi:hypothetical protein
MDFLGGREGVGGKAVFLAVAVADPRNNAATYMIP